MISRTLGLSGNNAVDMIIATLVSGFVLRYLPEVTAWIQNVIHKLIAAVLRWFWIKEPAVQTLHCITIDSRVEHKVLPDDGEYYATPLQTPNLKLPENMGIILGILHTLQPDLFSMKQCGMTMAAHMQLARRNTMRENLLNAVIALVPTTTVEHEGMYLTFSCTENNLAAEEATEQKTDETNNNNNNTNNAATKQPTPPPASSQMSLKIEGKDLAQIKSFMQSCFIQEINQLYPAPPVIDTSNIEPIQYSYELSVNHPEIFGNNTFGFYKTRYSTTKII